MCSGLLRGLRSVRNNGLAFLLATRIMRLWWLRTRHGVASHSCILAMHRKLSGGDGYDEKPEEEAAEMDCCWPETAGVSLPKKQTGRGSIPKFCCCSSVAAAAAAADDGGGHGGRILREQA